MAHGEAENKMFQKVSQESSKNEGPPKGSSIREKSQDKVLDEKMKQNSI